MFLTFEGRPSDSPFADRIRRSSSQHAAIFSRLPRRIGRWR